MQEIGRWKLRAPEGEDGPPDVPLWLQRLATDLSDVSKDGQGTLAARPVSTPISPSNTPGRYWFVTGDADTAQNHRLYRDTGSAWVEIAVGAGRTREVGEYKYAVDAASHGARGDNLPSWILCDGAELVAGYARLIAKLSAAGNPFGVGGAGRPRVAPFAGRVPLGVGAGSGLTSRLLGASVGAETHALILSETPAHKHAENMTDQAFASGAVTITVPTEATSFNNNPHFADSFQTSAGGGGAHNNMQPSVAAGSWFIYAGPEG